MPDLKYLSRVLYILINCFFKQIVDIFLTTLTIKSHIHILIIEFSSVVTVAEWLDRSFKNQSRLEKTQQWFDTRKSQNMHYMFLSIKQ